MQLSAGGPAGY